MTENRCLKQRGINMPATSTLLKLILMLMPLSVLAKDGFTALEQQQISIQTAGLFSRSDAFTVDLAALRAGDYAFPLPVGKAKHGKDYTIEIETRKGDAVMAMFGGTVRLSRNHRQYGNVIVVRHDNGLETMYAHNAQNMVNTGDRVKAGQTIAIVGGEDGRHYCEFAIMVNGSRINPEIIIGLNSHKLHRNTILCKKQDQDGRVDISVIPAADKGSNGNKTPERKENPADINPFAGSDKFTVDFSNMSIKDWCYPLQNAKVISPYGRRGKRSHSGVDIKTKPNDNILAAFDGIVTFSGKYSGYGNLVRIKHYNGLETYYSHNSKNLVKAGDRVKAGHVIALTGRTGRATTEHLHFEVRINGQHFDPAKIFDHLNHSVRQEAVTFTKKGNRVSISSDKKYMAKGKK